MAFALMRGIQHRHPRLDSINERALDFVCVVIDPFVSSIPDRPGMRRLQDQLVGSSGGIGANLEEALDEGLQIARIIAAIVINTKNNSDDD